jgi:hypothetical protein
MICMCLTVYILLHFRHFLAGVLAVLLLTSISCIIPGVIMYVNNYPGSSAAFIHRFDVELVVTCLLLFHCENA